MRLDNEKVRVEKWYRVGYIAFIKKYVLATVVPWIVLYDRYFEITEAEYLLFESDLPRLDALAKELSELGECSERLLFSEKNEENTSEQAQLLQKCVQYARNITETTERI